MDDTTVKKIRLISRIFFLIIIACFFLPFVSYSCEGMGLRYTEIASATGLDFMIGTEVEFNAKFLESMKNINPNGDSTDDEKLDMDVVTNDMGISENEKEVKISYFVILAFSVALLGLILCFSHNNKYAIMIGIIAILGLIFLLLFQLDTKKQLTDFYNQIGMETIKINYLLPYWIACFFFLLAAIANFATLKKPKRSVHFAEPVLSEDYQKNLE